MNEFTKTDLKDGMWLKSRHGFLWKVDGDDLIDKNGNKDYDLSHFDENLKCKHKGVSNFKRYDIMSVFEIVEKEVWVRQEWFKVNSEDKKWMIEQEGIDENTFVLIED